MGETAMTLLVVGRSGQLARALSEAAEERGYAFVAIGREEADLLRPGAVGGAIARLAPQLVINTAAYTAVDAAEGDPGLALRLNAEGAGEIAQAARGVGAQLIHVSTDYVFDGRGDRPYREEDPANPLSVYGRTKLAGEAQVRAAHPDALIVRTAWLHGPHGRNFVRTMLNLARDGKPVRVVADQRGSPTAALDLASALLGVAVRWAEGERTGQGETLHLAGAGMASWHELALAVFTEARAIGAPAVDPVPIPSSEHPTAAPRPAFSALDCGRWARLFGTALPPWREGVARSVARLASR